MIVYVSTEEVRYGSSCIYVNTTHTTHTIHTTLTTHYTHIAHYTNMYMYVCTHLDTKKCIMNSSVLPGFLYMKLVATVGSHSRNVTGSSSMVECTMVQATGSCSIQDTRQVPVVVVV